MNRHRRHGCISMQLILAIICAVVSVLGAGYTAHTSYGISVDQERPQTYGVEVQSEIQDLKRRLNRLERPHHPGRIGQSVGASADHQ